MEEVSISEIEKQADSLEDNDLLLISQYNTTDDSFDSAKISAKNLRQKLPGLMVRMWNCHNAQLELPYEGRDVINNLTYETDKFNWYESRTGTRNTIECETAIGPLATNGCSMLYKATNYNDQYFHDWYNNSHFWYYAGSYDIPAKYQWTYEVNRTIDSREESHKYVIVASELAKATVYNLTAYINDIQVDEITNFSIINDPQKFTFTLRITDTTNPLFEYYKYGVTFNDVLFTGFNKSTDPVSPAQSISDDDVPDEKVVVYEGKIKLERNKTIKIKGYVDNFASIFINSVQLCDFVSYTDQEINVEFTSRDNKLYYDFKLIIANYGTNGPGFENDFPDYSDLKMSLDDGTTWIKMSNESLSCDNQVFFLPNGCDNYYREAQELRDNGCHHKPGMLIKMWHSGYTVGKMSAACIFDHDVIDKVEPRDYKIYNAVDVEGTKYNLLTYQNLDVTSGCEMLYFRSANRYDPAFFDWFNGKTWNYYAGGGENSTAELAYDTDPRDKKVAAYFCDIYLAKNQSIYFKGYVDDSVSVLIDGKYPVSDDEDAVQLKAVVYSSKNAARTYKFTSEYTGYHSVKVIACNCATTSGPRAEVTDPVYSNTLKLSFDKTNWYHISNDGVGRDLFFIPNDNRYDEIYKLAQITRDEPQLPRLPGMLVKTWYCNVPSSCWGTNSFNPDVIDQAPPGITSIANSISHESVNYTLATYQALNVTSGCGILYKRCDSSDPSYFDYFNAKSWNFYSGLSTETHAEKLLIYYTKLYLHKDQIISFKGNPDNTISILIDNEYPTDSSGTELKYVTCDTAESGATKVDVSDIFTYTATFDGYHDMRIIVTNSGGPGGKRSDDANVVFSLNGGTNWYEISNDSFDNAIFFIPDDAEYRRLWYKSQLARDKYLSENLNKNTAIPNYSSPTTLTKVSAGTNIYKWTATSNGTMFVCIGGIVPNTSTVAIVSIQIPGSETWVEIAEYAPHHSSGKWQISYQNINIAIPFRVINGTSIKIENLTTISYEKVQLFPDL